MPATTRDAIVGTTLIACVCLAGCDRKQRVQGVESSTSWFTGGSEGIPGVDEACVTFETLKAGPPEGVSFVVWSDLLNGSSSAGSASGQGASCEGRHSARDGRHFEYRAQTTDGKAGTVTIADVDYDLAEGSLFLVSARDGPPKVAQISFDLSALPKKSQALKELAKSNPQIRGFFEKHMKAGARSKKREA
jgi:hypothetical protein